MNLVLRALAAPHDIGTLGCRDRATTTQPAKPKLLENFPVCQSERACLLSLDYERKTGEGETDILRVTHTHASACVFR